MGDDIGGIAVHISAQAESQELLVSRSVKDLVAGSGIQFTDRGAHALKGVPGSRRVSRWPLRESLLKNRFHFDLSRAYREH